MQYKIIKSSAGKQSVSFACPACQDVLRTPLESAGQPVDCPTCGQRLVCPGVDELESQRQSARAIAEAQQRAAVQANTGVKPAEAARRAQASESLAAMAPPPPAAPSVTMAYEPANGFNARVPTYRGLTIASSVLRIYAILLYVFGGLAVVVGILAVIRGSMNGASIYAAAAGMAASLVPGLGLLFAAAMAHGISAALSALRDIAINSFR